MDLKQYFLDHHINDENIYYDDFAKEFIINIINYELNMRTDEEIIDRWKLLLYPGMFDHIPEETAVDQVIEFGLLSFWLYKNNYIVSEFPDFLRKWQKPYNFSYNELRRKTAEKYGYNGRGNGVSWKDREIFIDNLSIITEDDQASLEYLFIKNHKFSEVNLFNVVRNNELKNILETRLNEALKANKMNLSLSSIILAASVLEGILYSLSNDYPKEFNGSRSSPKNKDKKTKKFKEWTLNDFLKVSLEIGVIEKDVFDFSLKFVDYRNYVHPREQLASNFNPSKETSDICLSVLHASIVQIRNFVKK